jgi:uncharacterized protein with PIN domain
MQRSCTLGSSSWSVSAAIAHVERVDLEDHARSLYRAISEVHHPLPETSELPTEVTRSVRRRARDGLLLALRDGYIRATGRLSTTQALFPDPRPIGSWRLSEAMSRLLEGIAVEIETVSAAGAFAVVEAYSTWGKGTHPAGLNFGDCFSYVTAKVSGSSLLYVGDDFAKTDLHSAL